MHSEFHRIDFFLLLRILCCFLVHYEWTWTRSTLSLTRIYGRLWNTLILKNMWNLSKVAYFTNVQREEKISGSLNMNITILKRKAFPSLNIEWNILLKKDYLYSCVLLQCWTETVDLPRARTSEEVQDIGPRWSYSRRGSENRQLDPEHYTAGVLWLYYPHYSPQT